MSKTITVRVHGRLFPREDEEEEPQSTGNSNANSTTSMNDSFAFMDSADDFAMDNSYALDGWLGGSKATSNASITISDELGSPARPITPTTPKHGGGGNSNVFFEDGSFQIQTITKAVNIQLNITVYALKVLVMEKFVIPIDEASEYNISCIWKGGENEHRFYNDADIVFEQVPQSLIEGGDVRFFLSHSSLKDCKRKITVEVSGKHLNFEVNAGLFSSQVMKLAADIKPFNTIAFCLTNGKASDSPIILDDWSIPYTYKNPYFIATKNKPQSSSGVISRVKSIGRKKPSKIQRPSSVILPTLNSLSEDGTQSDLSHSADESTSSQTKVGRSRTSSLTSRSDLKPINNKEPKRQSRRKSLKPRPTSTHELTANDLQGINPNDIQKLLAQGGHGAMKQEIWESTPGLFTSTISEATKNGTEIPDCILKCTTEITNRGLQSKGIYRITGSIAKTKELKLSFHQSQAVNLEGVSVNTCAGIVKYFFMSLKESIFGEASVFTAIEALPDEEKQIAELKSTFKRLPQPNRFLLDYLFTHLKPVASNAEVNMMPERNLAVVFAPGLQIPFSLLEFVFKHYDDSWKS